MAYTKQCPAIYQFYGYMGNIGIPIFVAIPIPFDCAGTTPSVSCSEEIEVEVEQEVQYGQGLVNVP